MKNFHVVAKGYRSEADLVLAQGEDGLGIDYIEIEYDLEAQSFEDAVKNTHDFLDTAAPHHLLVSVETED